MPPICKHRWWICTTQHAPTHELYLKWAHHRYTLNLTGTTSYQYHQTGPYISTGWFSLNAQLMLHWCSFDATSMLPRCPFDASLKMLFQFNFNALWILINVLMLHQCSSSAIPMPHRCSVENLSMPFNVWYYYYDPPMCNITKFSMEQAYPSGRVYICPFSPPPPPPGIFWMLI